MRILSKIIRCVLSALFSLSLTACGDSAPPAPSPSVGAGTLRVYTSVPIAEIEEIIAKYGQERPEVGIELIRAGSGEILKRLGVEAESGTLKADVIWIADFASAERLKQKGLLHPYASPEARDYFHFFRDPEGYYTGSRLLHMVVVYNKLLVGDKPVGYQDLLRPGFEGRIGIGAPGSSGAALFAAGTFLMEREFGWEYFYRLREHGCRLYEQNDSIVAEVAKGTLAMGIGLDFIARREMQKSPTSPLDYSFPREGTIAVASPIAIGRDCANLPEARAFVDWVLSMRGQDFMARELGISPVHPRVKEVPGTLPLHELRVLPADARRIAANVEAIRRILGDIFAGKPIAEIDPVLVER